MAKEILMCDATLASCFTLPSRDQLLQGAKLRFNGASGPVVWEGGRGDARFHTWRQDKLETNVLLRSENVSHGAYYWLSMERNSPPRVLADHSGQKDPLGYGKYRLFLTEQDTLSRVISPYYWCTLFKLRKNPVHWAIMFIRNTIPYNEVFEAERADLNKQI